MIFFIGFKSIVEELTFFYFILCGVKIYLCKSHIYNIILKNTNIFDKCLNWI
jgi:hypothetical protein